MRLVMFADAKTNRFGWNTSGWHVFGNADMRDCWAPVYWYNYSNTWPSSGGVSVKTVSDIIIYSHQPPTCHHGNIPQWRRDMAAWHFSYNYLELSRQPGFVCEDCTHEGRYGSWHHKKQRIDWEWRNGSYTWPISSSGSGGTGSDYKVSVQSISQPTIKDTSNNNFTIAPAQTASTITVTSPNGGETWQRGTSHTITWSYTGSPGSYVKIVLMKGSTAVGTIKSSVSTGSGGNGSYTWPISSSGSGGPAAITRSAFRA